MLFRSSREASSDQRRLVFGDGWHRHVAGPFGWRGCLVALDSAALEPRSEPGADRLGRGQFAVCWNQLADRRAGAQRAVPATNAGGCDENSSSVDRSGLIAC